MVTPTPDDFFRCQQFLFDYDEWCIWVMSKQTFSAPGYAPLVLRAAEARQIEVIRYYESHGWRFEPPDDFWVERGQMAHLVDSGEWTPLGEFSGYPSASR